MTDGDDVVRSSGRIGFVIAGVQKAGTSSLFAMVSEHPQVGRARAKELHFFSNESAGWPHPDFAAYEARIRWTEATTIAGDATPSYVFWPGAMERVKAYNPEMRIVLSFRDPVERAFSAWCMLKERDPSRPGFGDAVRTGHVDQWPRKRAQAGRPLIAMVGRGFYGEQLAHTLELFERDQVLLLDYHRVFADTGAALDEITDFLGIDRLEQELATARERSMPQALEAPEPVADDVLHLARLYASDLDRFGELSGLDVASWPTARVARGELDPAEVAASLAARANLQPPPEGAPAGPATIGPPRRGRRASRARASG